MTYALSRAFRLCLVGLALWLGLLGFSQAALGLEDDAEVRIGEVYVLTLHGRLGSTRAQERARNVARNILALARDPLVSPSELVVQEGENGVSIDCRGDIILLVTSNDARVERSSKGALATKWAADIKRAIKEYRAQAADNLTPPQRFGRLVMASISALLAFWLIRRARKWRHSPTWRDRSVALGGARTGRISTFAASLLLTSFQIITSLAYLGTALGYVIYVLWLFPATQVSSYELLFWVTTPLRILGKALIGYVPNFFIIAAIVLFANFFLRFLLVLFLELEEGALELPGFDRDCAKPSYNLVKAIVVIAGAIAIFPYIPGSDSHAFQGISLFLGFMVSVSSSLSIGNLIAGTLLIFARAYRVGDRVEIGSTTGIVLTRELLATKLLTPANVVVTVPSANILAGQIRNFSSEALERGILVTSTLTLGYDLPWRKVHDLLIAAALATPEIESEPEPFVVQRQLNDFHISYELNASTRNPLALYKLPGALNERIQDAFREAGNEILSPSYLALRSGRESTVPTLTMTSEQPTQAIERDSVKDEEPAPARDERTI